MTSRFRTAALRAPSRFGAYGMFAVLALVPGAGLLPQCAPPPPPPPAVVASTPVNDAAVALVNQHRSAAGRRALTTDARLLQAAQDHANDQARRQKMSHTGSNGSDAGQRITAAGYRWSTWGENVAAGQRTADDVVRAWMNSSSHRTNILSSSMVHIGVASATGDNGVTYWTMVLAAGG